MDHILWQTYKTRTCIKNTAYNSFCYTNEEKAESFAENFEYIYNTVWNTPFSIDHEIESLAISLHTNSLTCYSTLKCMPRQIKNLIKKLPNNKAPKPDKINTIALKKFPIKPIQLYYIFKTASKRKSPK